MKRIASGLVLAGAIVAFAAPAQAAVPSADFSFGPAPTFNCSTHEGEGNEIGCGDVSPNHGSAGGDGTCLVLIGGIGRGGITGAQFGVEYGSTGGTQLGQFGHGACVDPAQAISIDGPNGSWPSSGSGVALAFQGACLRPATDGGLIPVYQFTWAFGNSPPVSGTMFVIGDPTEGVTQVTDCHIDPDSGNPAPRTHQIPAPNRGSYDFSASGGGSTGCGGAVPTEDVSWGAIKALF